MIIIKPTGYIEPVNYNGTNIYPLNYYNIWTSWYSFINRIINSSFYYPVPKAEISIKFSYLFFLFSSLGVRSVRDNLLLKLPGTGLRLTLSQVNTWDSDMLGYVYQMVGSTHCLDVLDIKDLAPSEKTPEEEGIQLGSVSEPQLSEAKVNLSKAWYLSPNFVPVPISWKSSCYFKRVRSICKLKGQVKKAVFTFGTFLGFYSAN